MRRSIGSISAAVVLSFAAAVSAADFYEAQMRAGEQALAAGRAPEAADALRVGSFGLLEKPALLSECLAALAVAQKRAHRDADADATLQRFRAVQTLFPAPSELSAMAADVRAAFEAFARERVPGFTLRSTIGSREAKRSP